jgi:hypothetical protein
MQFQLNFLFVWLEAIGAEFFNFTFPAPPFPSPVYHQQRWTFRGSGAASAGNVRLFASPHF